MHRARGYAAYSSDSRLGPFTSDRRYTRARANEVRIAILFCGVGRSDLYTARGHWDGLIYPDGTAYHNVPGHELMGRVTEVGNSVARLKIGDLRGVGCMLDRCQRCAACEWD